MQGLLWLRAAGGDSTCAGLGRPLKRGASGRKLINKELTRRREACEVASLVSLFHKLNSARFPRHTAHVHRSQKFITRQPYYTSARCGA